MGVCVYIYIYVCMCIYMHTHTHIKPTNAVGSLEPWLLSQFWLSRVRSMLYLRDKRHRSRAPCLQTAADPKATLLGGFLTRRHLFQGYFNYRSCCLTVFSESLTTPHLGSTITRECRWASNELHCSEPFQSISDSLSESKIPDPDTQNSTSDLFSFSYMLSLRGLQN